MFYLIKLVDHALYLNTVIILRLGDGFLYFPVLYFLFPYVALDFFDVLEDCLEPLVEFVDELFDFN